MGNYSKLFGLQDTWADMDMMDLGPNSSYRGTPAAVLHATVWMLARSPLMYSGPLPITDALTLTLMTHPTALRIHSSAGRLHTSYQGDCSCHERFGNSGCIPTNSPGAAPCVAIWWAELPAGGTERAVGILNIGATAANVSVSVRDIDGPSGAKSAQNVYGGGTIGVTAGKITVMVPPVGAVLLTV